MAEYEVYKNTFQNQVTSLIGHYDLPDGSSYITGDTSYPMNVIKPIYWGTILEGSPSQFVGNDYIDTNVLFSGYKLPGTEEYIQKVGWIGNNVPFNVMKNSKGTWALFPGCIKYPGGHFSTNLILFCYNNGEWVYSDIFAPIGIRYVASDAYKTSSESISAYNSVIPGSIVGFYYESQLDHIRTYIIFSNGQWFYSKSFRYGFSSYKAGWSKESVIGPDVPGPPPLPEPVNPYAPGGPSGEGTEPPGTFDDSSDAIPDSSLPTLSAANTGFTRIYNPTLAQVQDLARYLWTDETVIQTIWNHIKQYFEDPMQAIIGFNLVPCAVPDAGSQSFALMYIDTGVQMNVAANQFVDVDCGSVKLERYYGSALDQSPYTRVSCFLPFIGTVKLNTDEVMGTTLQVKYRIDICSGSCVAKIAVDGNIIYQYSGHCAINIPISSADFSSYVQATMSIAKLAVGAAVGGAMGAMAATSTEPSQQTNRAVTTTRTETSTERNPATGRQVTAGTSTVTTREETHSETSTKASFDYLTPSNIANTVGQVMSSKPIVEHTGSFSGNSGYLGIRRPFLIIERPNMCLPEKYQQFNGYPAMITMKLGECKGYTKLQQVQLTGMTATNPEQAELMGLLKSGVIF